MFDKLSKSFKFIKPYMATIPTYPTAMWLFFHVSNTEINTNKIKIHTENPKILKYINNDILKACYSLPNFIKDNL